MEYKKKQSGFIEICFGWNETGSEDWLAVKKRVEAMLEYFRTLGGETIVTSDTMYGDIAVNMNGDIAVNFICNTPESEALYYFWLKYEYLQEEYENDKELYELK